ncbi:MAG: recombinase family protein [Clostridia bacterium]|nr:recombinase family protein [Clostridia bacterium]
MAKAILLVRVSTERQSYDEQEKQLYSMAVADGYKDNDIIPIAEKESGIKLTEEQRKGLNRMKEVIATEDVAVVYAWEISRIARKKKILFNILDLLTAKKIQLKIYDPNISLLKDDGTIDESSEMIFTLFAQMAESEMRNKAARFHRAKTANAEKMKYNGGRSVRYGYRLNENNVYEIDPEQAEVVKLVFNMYKNENIGAGFISRELKQRGIHFSQFAIRDMLRNECYTGQCVTRHGILRNYPVIIDRETWDTVAAKRKTNNKCAVKTKKYYFGGKLLYCPECGTRFTVQSTQHVYKCSRVMTGECHAKMNVNATAVDSILWHEVQMDLITSLAFDKADKIADYEEKISILEQKIAACEKVIEKVSEKMQRVANAYINGIIDEDAMKAKRDKINEEAKQAENNRVQFTAQVKNYSKMIETIKKGNNITDRLNEADDAVNNIDNIKEMYDIIHTFIKKVELEEVRIMGQRARKITITHVSGEVANWYYFAWRKTGVKIYKEPSINYPPAKQALIEKGLLIPMPFDEDFKKIPR